MLKGCRQFVNEVLRAGRVSRSELIRFIRQNVGHAQENLDRATAYRIDNYHAQATAWRAKLGPEKWAALRVVILGSSMARRHSLTTQYFAKLLGEPGESDRIVYAESLFDEQKALERLGTHLFDTHIGEDFFGSLAHAPRRTWRICCALFGCAIDGLRAAPVCEYRLSRLGAIGC